MEKAPEFSMEDVQAILKTSERLNKHKDEIKRFLKIIEGFLEESGELNHFLVNGGLGSGSEIIKVNFNIKPLEGYSCSLWSNYSIYMLSERSILFTLCFMGIRQNRIEISAGNVNGLSRHLVPIFYLMLPEILEALVNLFPKLRENIQELIRISDMTQ
ncbi:MAG: hypothetical protein HYV51_03065 [Parcubacteria group bacterium]|nr:hypothetical protein [Parcubacteria group bacterium]